MGLDMYLSRKLYFFDPENKLKIQDSRVDANKVSCVEEEWGYWRKANAIHQWFVDNVQEGVDDCGEYMVDKDDMTALLNIVNQILEDHSKANELLPTASGFFFGGTDYDDWYFMKLENTKTILEDCLACDGGDFFYYSSW